MISANGDERTFLDGAGKECEGITSVALECESAASDECHLVEGRAERKNRGMLMRQLLHARRQRMRL